VYTDNQTDIPADRQMHDWQKSLEVEGVTGLIPSCQAEFLARVGCLTDGAETGFKS
jgi:peroxiredoxin